jgi:hypothetical protein
MGAIMNSEIRNNRITEIPLTIFDADNLPLANQAQISVAYDILVVGTPTKVSTDSNASFNSQVSSVTTD